MNIGVWVEIRCDLTDYLRMRNADEEIALAFSVGFYDVYSIHTLVERITGKRRSGCTRQTLWTSQAYYSDIDRFEGYFKELSRRVH